MNWIFLIVGLVIGFFLAWIIGKILASREFDQLLFQEEQRHQDLINEFTEKLYDKQDIIDDLKEQLFKKGDSQ